MQQVGQTKSDLRVILDTAFRKIESGEVTKQDLAWVEDLRATLRLRPESVNPGSRPRH